MRAREQARLAGFSKEMAGRPALADELLDGLDRLGFDCDPE